MGSPTCPYCGCLAVTRAVEADGNAPSRSAAYRCERCLKLHERRPTPPPPPPDAKSPFPAPERAAFPSLYCNIYPDLLPVARSLGYALAIHGSVSRDLDLIAVPWTEDARPPEELVEAIRAKFDGWIGGATAGHPFVDKPHGRRAWSIMLGGHAVVDLSVVPVVGAMPADDASVEHVIQALGAETGIHRLYAHERMALVRAVLNTRADDASGAGAMREACAKACLLAADECPGTEDEVATWREASMWCVNAIRALPVPSASAVERAFDDYLRRLAESIGVDMTTWDDPPAHGNARLRWAAIIQIRLDTLLRAEADAPASEAPRAQRGGDDAR